MSQELEDLEESVRRQLPFMAKYIMTRVIRHGEDGYFSDFRAFKELQSLRLIDRFTRIYLDISDQTFEAQIGNGFNLYRGRSSQDLELKCMDDEDSLLVPVDSKLTVKIPAQPVLDEYSWKIQWPSMSRGEMKERIDQYLTAGGTIAQ